MTDRTEGAGASRRTHSKSLSAPFLEFDLQREMDLLHREAEWSEGRNARTLVKYEDLRVVLIALRAGSRIPEHAAGGQVSIQGLAGEIQVRAEGKTFRLTPGGLLTLDRWVLHEVEGIRDGAFLLTVSWSGREGGAPTPESQVD